MKKNHIALLLCAAMLFAVLTGCAPKEEAAQTSETEIAEENAEPAEIEKETEQAEPVEEEPVEEIAEEPVRNPKFLEAMQLMGKLNAVSAEAAEAPCAALTGAEAKSLLNVFGVDASALDDAAVLTGADFLPLAMSALGYDAAASADEAFANAEKLFVLQGIENYDAAAELVNEDAAQIMRNALLAKKTDGTKLSDSFGLSYEIDPEYADGFNRPAGKWVMNGEDATETFACTPLRVVYDKICWCDVLDILGYNKADEANNPMITFQNTYNGGEYTVKFEKCHWDNGSGAHSGCANDWTNETLARMEIYRISDTEYRNVYRDVFLGKVSGTSISLYGYNDEVWGPWDNEGLPEAGMYLVNYHWNTYGSGEGFEILQLADTMVGTLEAITDTSLTIDGTEQTPAALFNFGKILAKSSIGIGKTYTFYLDQLGRVIGCGEYFG